MQLRYKASVIAILGVGFCLLGCAVNAQETGWSDSTNGQNFSSPNTNLIPAQYPDTAKLNRQFQAAPKAVNPQQVARINSWFVRYDEIRRRAQMNPLEKQQADSLLSRGFSLLMPGQDKIAAKQILFALVQRYQKASLALEALPVVPETKQLQLAYYQYFNSAMKLFSDYLRVQDNLMAADTQGQALAPQLMQRKSSLEAFEHSCKNMDAQVRLIYGLAPYQY